MFSFLFVVVFQLHITVTPKSVRLNVDCQEVAEKEIKEARNVSTDGYEVLGKMAKSGGARRESATVSEKLLEKCSKRSPRKSSSYLNGSRVLLFCLALCPSMGY